MLTVNRGWITVGELKVGDVLFEEKGQHTNVTHLHPIVTPEKAYKLIFSDGAEMIADPEHLWYTETVSSRQSMSMQKMFANKGHVRAAMMLFSAEETQTIQGVIDNTDSSEVASIPDIAAIIDRHETSKYLYTVAKIIGPAEEIHPTRKYFYNAQIVVQKQNLLHYNSAEFMELFNSRPIRRTTENPLKTTEIDKLRQLKLEIRDTDKLTTTSIYEYLGFGGSDIAKRWVRANFDGSIDSLIAASDSIKGLELPDQIFEITKEYINNHEFASIMGKDSSETRALFGTFKNRVVDKFTKLTPIELIVPEKTLTRKAPSYFAYPKKMFLEQILARSENPINDQRHKMSKGSVKTTQEIFDTLRTNLGKANHSIELTKPLEYPEKELSIPPYALGAWLGDGYVHDGNICGEDHEVKNEIVNLGYSVIERKPSREYISQTYRIWSFPELKKQLKSEGLLLKYGNTVRDNGTTKHIPSEYFSASISQRKELLAGLMDTDGTVNPNKGTLSFTTIIPQLRDDFIALVRTLGYMPAVSSRFHTNNVTGSISKEAYTIQFAAKPDDNVFRIARKNVAHVKHYKGGNKESTSNRRFIVDVVEVAPEPMRCISVDSASRLFVAGEALIATHNSVAQRNIVFHCIQHNDKWCFLGVDPKKVELKPYAKYKNTVLGIGTTLEDMVEIIRYAKEEMMTRYETMEELEVNHFEDLPNPPRAIMLMVDEAYMLMATAGNKTDQGKEDDALHGEASFLIGEIARLGRAAGVHLVLAMQRPDAVVLKGEIKNNLEVRIAAGRLDSTPSAMVLDNGLATRVPSNIRGRGVAQINGDGQLYQGYFAPQNWIDDWLLANPEREPEVIEMLMKKRAAANPEMDLDMPENLDDINEFLGEVEAAEVEAEAEAEVKVKGKSGGLNMSKDVDVEPVKAGKSSWKDKLKLGKKDTVSEPDSDVVPVGVPDAVVDKSRFNNPSDFLAENKGREGFNDPDDVDEVNRVEVKFVPETEAETEAEVAPVVKKKVVAPEPELVVEDDEYEYKLQPEDIDPSLYGGAPKSVAQSEPEQDNDAMIADLLKLLEDEDATDFTKPDTVVDKPRAVPVRTPSKPVVAPVDKVAPKPNVEATGDAPKPPAPRMGLPPRTTLPPR